MSYKKALAGWLLIDDKKYWMRSRWERCYGAYLEWLRQLGEIQDWEYEPDEFEYPIRRGTRFYKPDFKIYNSDGSVEYHEIKGYWTPKAGTQVARFRKYYPELKLVVIEKDEFNAIAAKSALIPGWEE